MKEEYMKMLQEKAEVLIEALPYIQQFNRRIIVVKYGGSAMVDEELKKRVIQDVALLKLVGFKPIIVHGGGKEVSHWVRLSGMEPEFVNGLRKTDAKTMEIAEIVLNKVNKSLVQLVQGLGVNAIGISGKDGGLLKVEKKYADGQDIGFVGEVTEVNPKIIHDLLEKDFLPIICPISMDDSFQSYNINADDAASATAKALGAEKLAFLTEFYDTLENTIKTSPEIANSPAVSAEEKLCPSCGAPMVVRRSRFGKLFYGCSKYPKCTGLVNIS
jgi:acetylglutamate kinase